MHSRLRRAGNQDRRPSRTCKAGNLSGRKNIPSRIFLEGIFFDSLMSVFSNNFSDNITFPDNPDLVMAAVPALGDVIPDHDILTR